jgi:16S rRNA (cytosine1402-N4)-methyltransferase
MSYHVPVLLQTSVEYLITDKSGIYVDLTFGGGGHSRVVLDNLNEKGKLFGFDQDDDAKTNIIDDKRFTFINSNFSNMKNQLRLHGVKQVDGILADLGVSSHQFDVAERGFSFRFDALLDMRMNQTDGVTAAHLLNTLHADALQKIFGEYGEVRNSRTLANAIITARNTKKFEHISDLLSITEKLYFGEKHKYNAQVFQALRIEVNDEMNALKAMFNQTLEVLKPGGRLVVLSYHSLEDRCTKNFMKTGNFEGKHDSDFYGKITRPFELIAKKAIEPSEEEKNTNSRSRSAKMRVAAKL